MPTVLSRTGKMIRPVEKVFVVLGMHRSATSLVSRGLEEAGVDMGGDNRTHFHWEDNRFMGLNDAILKRAGGSWHCPPPEDEIINAGMAYAADIRLLIQSCSDQARQNKGYLWGWKDPRTTLTAKLFLDLLASPHLIMIHRNPMEVAQSLQRRNKFSIDRGYALAQEYNARMLSTVYWWNKKQSEREFIRGEICNCYPCEMRTVS